VIFFSKKEEKNMFGSTHVSTINNKLVVYCTKQASNKGKAYTPHLSKCKKHVTLNTKINYKQN